MTRLLTTRSRTQRVSLRPCEQLRRGRALPALAVLAVSVFALAHIFSSPVFVAPPSSAAAVQQQQALRGSSPDIWAIGAAAGLAAAPAAHAEGGQLGLFTGSALLFDEILPVSLGVSFATLWGIILGFVLLRLQEAFPE